MDDEHNRIKVVERSLKVIDEETAARWRCLPERVFAERCREVNVCSAAATYQVAELALVLGVTVSRVLKMISNSTLQATLSAFNGIRAWSIYRNEAIRIFFFTSYGQRRRNTAAVARLAVNE